MQKAILTTVCAGLIVFGAIGAAAAQTSGGAATPGAPASNQIKVTGTASSSSDAMAKTTKKKAKKSKMKKSGAEKKM